MKIEKINDNMVRITISLAYLLENNIDFSKLKYDTPEAQEFFLSLIRLAEKKFNFNISKSKLCIEAISESPEKYVINISKFEPDSEFESIQNYIKDKYKTSDLKKKNFCNNICSPCMIYKFKNINDLKKLVSRIEYLYFGESILYLYNNYYHLLLTKNHWSALLDIKTVEILLYEYGDKLENTTFMEGILNEYGKKIAYPDALSIIKEYY